MKTGISTNLFDRFAHWGEDIFKNLKKHGFDAAGYNISVTDTAPYTLSQAARFDC